MSKKTFFLICAVIWTIIALVSEFIDIPITEEQFYKIAEYLGVLLLGGGYLYEVKTNNNIALTDSEKQKSSKTYEIIDCSKE